MISQLDLQPSLTDGVISLKPLSENDWEALFAVAADPKIWEQHPAHDRWQETVFRAFFDDALASRGCMVAREVATGEVIGSSRFDFSRAEDDEVEVGWTFLARSHWGGGTNRRMKRLMIGHALQHVRQVIFLVGETNIRSRRAMEKIGGHLTERSCAIKLPDGDAIHVIYAVDESIFLTGPLSRPGG